MHVSVCMYLKCHKMSFIKCTKYFTLGSRNILIFLQAVFVIIYKNSRRSKMAVVTHEQEVHKLRSRRCFSYFFIDLNFYIYFSTSSIFRTWLIDSMKSSFGH